MEMSNPQQDEEMQNTDEKKPPAVIPCKLCGSLIIESYYELHLAKVCRKKNAHILGGFVEEDEGDNEEGGGDNEDDEDDYLDEEGEDEDEEEGFSKKELQFIMAN